MTIPDGLRAEVTQALADLAHWHVQSSIDGASNIWILKPGGKSRGRGISCTNSWADIKVCTQLAGLMLRRQQDATYAVYATCCLNFMRPNV